MKYLIIFVIIVSVIISFTTVLSGLKAPGLTQKAFSLESKKYVDGITFLKR